MTALAILPILPALGGLLWSLAGLLALALTALRPRWWSWWLRLAKSQWRGLLTLGAVGLSGLALYSASTGRFRTGPPSSPAAAALGLDGWPMFRGAPDRCGLAFGPGPNAGGVLWVGRPEYDFVASPALSGDYVVAVGMRGGASRCFVWERSSGREVWSGAPHGYRPTLASPVLSGGCIYVGEGVHHTRDARIVCLDPARAEGPVRWEFATRGHVECTPLVAGGMLYAAAGDDGVYALDLAGAEAVALDRGAGSGVGGAQHDAPLSPSVRWHLPGHRFPDAETALAVHAGRLYVGLGFESPALVAIDARTGVELARIALPLPTFAPPTLFAGGLLLGMGPGHLLNAATAGAGEARLIDPETLATRWRLSTPASVINSAAVCGDVAVIVSADGTVFAVTANGKVERSRKLAAPVVAAPAVAGNRVYIVSQEGLLVGLSGDTLQPFWEARLGPPGLYISSPAVSGDHVYVGTPQGLVCAGRAER